MRVWCKNQQRIAPSYSLFLFLKLPPPSSAGDYWYIFDHGAEANCLQDTHSRALAGAAFLNCLLYIAALLWKLHQGQVWIPGSHGIRPPLRAISQEARRCEDDFSSFVLLPAGWKLQTKTSGRKNKRNHRVIENSQEMLVAMRGLCGIQLALQLLILSMAQWRMRSTARVLASCRSCCSVFCEASLLLQKPRGIWISVSQLKHQWFLWQICISCISVERSFFRVHLPQVTLGPPLALAYFRRFGAFDAKELRASLRGAKEINLLRAIWLGLKKACEGKINKDCGPQGSFFWCLAI